MQKEEELAHVVPDYIPKIHESNWPKTMDAILVYLGSFLGVKNAPLSYVVRAVQEHPPNPDPATGVADSKYSSFSEEVTARAPHFLAGNALPYVDTFIQDNTTVWNLMRNLCKDAPCWTVIRPWARAKDGRSAFWALYNHYLGASRVDNMASTAEKNLETAQYEGESKRWSFDHYVRAHME